MKTKILIFVYLALFGGALYFIYPIISDRYFNPQEETSSEKSTDKKSSLDETEDTEINNDDDSDDTPIEEVPEDVFIDIEAEDCEDGCEQFEDEEDKKYCQEYCGLLEMSDESDTDCESLEDLEKDYCYKNQAIADKDFKLCEKISDKKLRESCQNRITEELLNNQVID
ncbi:MAG: hypothetical protein V3574_01600 [Candidatus Moraniibacteriota bacterium]